MIRVVAAIYRQRLAGDALGELVGQTKCSDSRSEPIDVAT